MTTYISSTETAKLIRQALKESFPGVKFSVKTSKYSGGSSINVSWTDGPTSHQVDSIVKKFNGSYFDAITDYKGLNYYMMNGESVQFSADFVFTNRNYSDEQIQRAINSTCTNLKNNYESAGIEKPTVEQYRSGSLWNVIVPLCHHQGGQSVQGHISANLAKRSSFAAPAESKLFNSIVFTGDDGYGHGAVGKGANLKLVS